MKIETQITDEQLRSLLTNAFEGGSNYWYRDAEPVFAEGVTKDDVKEGGKLQPPEGYYHWIELLPTIPGCAVKVRVQEQRGYHLLDRAALERGAQVMAEKYPKHFADWMSENDDADTGDVFLQCCLFGDLVFG